MNNDTISLLDARHKEKYIISEVIPSEEMEKLAEFGVVNGAEIEVLRFAPFHSAVLAKLGNTILAIDKDISKTILVRKK